MPTANSMSGRPTRLLVSTSISRFVSKMPGKRKSSKKGITAVALTVATSASIDPKEQLQAAMQSLEYVEVYYFYLECNYRQEFFAIRHRKPSSSFS